MKMCRKCKSHHDLSLFFCPSCGSMLHNEPIQNNPQSFHQECEIVYNEWNPPSPATLLSKIYNLNYTNLKYESGMGVYSVTQKQIEADLNKRKYCCSNCSCYMSINYFCTTKGHKVTTSSICKSFEPVPKSDKIANSNISSKMKNGKKKKKNVRITSKKMSGEQPRTTVNVLMPKFVPFDPYK